MFVIALGSFIKVEIVTKLVFVVFTGTAVLLLKLDSLTRVTIRFWKIPKANLPTSYSP